MFKSRVLALLACLGLSACEQAQLQGPIGGGEVFVSEFRSGETVLTGLSTTDENALIALVGQETFDSYNALQIMSLVGLNTFQEPDFESDTWYVMAVQGGFDYDADGNGLPDQAPIQVFGSVHALVTGEQLNEGGFSITPVTEAAYRYAAELADGLSDDALHDLLDDAAEALVEDTDDDEDVDYDDVIGWNRLLYSQQLKADIDALTNAVASGASESTVIAAALALFPEATPGPAPESDPEEYFAQFASDVVQLRCGGCHRVGGSASRTRHVLQPTSNRNHIALNTDMYRSLVRQEGVEYILEKSQGGNRHGGGNRLGRFPEDFEILETFLSLLEDG